ncbi:MAG: hypothetical protein H0W88_07600 [Parachlamydiaceae bacterium]|nr:hypothetical protein [Parachlamydiaceae bacterium]
MSVGGGVAIAYVFIDLLPKLGTRNEYLEKIFADTIPFVERHAFIMALAGFLLFFLVDQSSTVLEKKRNFRFSMASYALFNFLVGYAVADINNPEVKPLVLFTFAMSLHYFTIDYNLSTTHGKEYRSVEKWLLIICLFLGWLVGALFDLPAAAIALVSAFIGGGVIMNVTRHELPKDNPHSLGGFFLATFLYTVILLTIN